MITTGHRPLPCANPREKVCRVPHTATSRRQRGFLPCAFFQAHGKPFPACQVWPSAKIWGRLDRWRGTPLCRVLSRPAVCQGICTRQIMSRATVLRASLPCAMVNAHGKEPSFELFFLSVTYMVPQALQAFHIYHNKHFMYPKKHRGHFILSRNTQMQRNSSLFIDNHKFKSSPYKLIQIKSIQIQV